MKKRSILFKSFLLSLVICMSIGLSAQETIHQFADGLTVPLKGKYGREAVFQDLLLWQIAEGKWETPLEGGIAFSGEDGAETKWSSISANDKGIFKHRNLRGGYLYCEYTSRKSQVAVLEVSGHNEVLVNGRPRGGDVYNFGWVQHPIQLKKGRNSFLFRGSRGQITASLKVPESRVFLSGRDPLLPDWQEGWTEKVPGALRLINATNNVVKGYQLVSVVNWEKNQSSVLPQIGPFTSRKVPFYINAKGFKAGDIISLSFVLLDDKGREVKNGETPVFEIKVKGPFDRRKETFISEIDGSVQYYSVVPPSVSDLDDPALFFSLHGASVEAVNQAGAYSPKDWGLLVAPTNRRPYGFDWEDWGRLDGKEVLGIVIDKYKPDSKRMYLTGHSMGGHGTWQFGVTYPGYWASIAPSAGWYSFWSYAGKEDVKEPGRMEEVFKRASNPSNTLALSENYLHYGVYILHGDADDNVPVGQARFMREHLAGFHADFAYYERPGAGHWWGNECVDWPPLFEFFRSHKRTDLEAIKKLCFNTSSPAISATSRFLTIWQQEENLDISRVEVNQDTNKKALKLESDNVQLLKLDLNHLQKGQPYDIICESDTFNVDPGLVGQLYLKKGQAGWEKTNKPGMDQKGPHRSGLFKEAFQNRMIFVHGTNGSEAENEWAYSKARFDAETFWYRGNGAVDVISDKEFLRDGAPGRNIILYGHADMNLAWADLLPESPIQVKRGKIDMGSETLLGDDLATYFIFPRMDEKETSIGVVAGTGMSGLKSAYANRYFVSGSGFPDFMIFKT